jgi:hypothetical protein
MILQSNNMSGCVGEMEGPSSFVIRRKLGREGATRSCLVAIPSPSTHAPLPLPKDFALGLSAEALLIWQL